MFIFTIDQELWTHELMDYIMGCDHFLNQKDILLYLYDPLSSFSTYASYPPQQSNHRHITTK
jgi:hypothetical protein